MSAVAPKQIQPNGIDLTIKSISAIDGPGILSKERTIIPPTIELSPGGGRYILSPGCYSIIFNEIINVPKDVVGIIFQRSSLSRMGGYTTSGIYDSGYRGELGCMLHLEYKIEIEKGVRLAQIVFLEAQSYNLYSGQYGKK